MKVDVRPRVEGSDVGTVGGNVQAFVPFVEMDGAPSRPVKRPFNAIPFSVAEILTPDGPERVRSSSDLLSEAFITDAGIHVHDEGKTGV